jgi:hypothetical protein
MRSPIAKAGLIFAALAVVTVALLVLGVRRQLGVECEVCVTFHGASACRSASGSTHDEARRTAHDNACAMISGGMTDSISCQNTPADSVRCSDDAGRP